MDHESCEAIFVRDDNICQGCRKRFLPFWAVDPPKELESGGNFLVVDHVDGPGNAPENLQTLCFRCNAKKSGKGRFNFQLSCALSRLGRPITFYPGLARYIGLKESVFACQVLYWMPRGRHQKGEGWIYKEASEMLAETSLTYREQKRIREKLLKLGVLEESHNRVEHRIYFRVNGRALDALMETNPDPYDETSSAHTTDCQVAPDETSIRETTNGQPGRAVLTTKLTQENLFLVFSSELLSVNKAQDEKLGDVYPWVARPEQYSKMELWLCANRPGQRVKNVLAFCQNWFNKIPCPVKGVSNGNGQTRAQTFAEIRTGRTQEAIRRVVRDAPTVADDIHRALPAAANRACIDVLPDGAVAPEPARTRGSLPGSRSDV